MPRDSSLVPLSHQHQHALALCVRIERGLRRPGADLAHWQAEIVRQFDEEIRYHFGAEEQVLFPAAARVPEVHRLVSELLQEHAELRSAIEAARAGRIGEAELLQFASTLSGHVRKEENQLFQTLQAAWSREQLARIGNMMAEYFRATACPARPAGSSAPSGIRI